MAFEEYIGKIVVGVESKRRYVLTKVTAPTIHVRTVEANSSGYPSHYVWETINGDPFTTGKLVFEDASLNEPFKAAYAAHTRSKEGSWEDYGYWMRKG